MSTVVVDMDGIIVDVYRLWLERYNNDYADNLTIGDIKDYYVPNWVKPECGEKIKHYLVEDLYNQAKPLPGALEAIHHLFDIGCTISVASALPFPKPDPGVAKAKLSWVYKYLPFVHPEDINLISRKYWAPGRVFIDDWDEQLINYREFGSKGAKLVTIDYPWNRSIQKHGCVDFVGRDWNNTSQAWEQITDYVQNVMASEYSHT